MGQQNNCEEIGVKVAGKKAKNPEYIICDAITQPASGCELR